MSLLALWLVLAAAPPSPGAAEPAPGDLPAAAAHLEAGRPEEALQVLGSAARPEARLVRGLALEAAGRAPEALAALEGLEAALPEVADRIEAARGRLLAGLGRSGESAEAFGAVPPGSLLHPAALLGRGRALAAAGDPVAALEALRPLLGAPPEGPLAAQAAPALLLAGGLRAALTPPDPAGARRDLLRCWSVRAAEPEAPACLAALRALPGEAGAAPPEAEVVGRAEVLLEKGRAGEAVTLLEPVVRGGPPPGPAEPAACRARVALGRALRRDRQNARAVEVLRPAAERCADPALHTRALFVLATAVSSAGSREEALALYRRFARTERDSPLADDALMAASELLAKDGRPAEARQLLETLVRDFPGGDRRDEARFRLAWLAWRAGDLEGAQAALLRIEEEARGVDPYEHARAAYWRARLLSGQGEAGRAAARAIWSGLVEAGPADYYALLARGRLAGTDGPALPPALAWSAPPAGPSGASPPAPGPLAEEPHLRAGLVLLRAGLRRLAAEELRAVDRPRPPGDGALASAIYLAELLERAGDLHAAHQLLRLEARALLRRPPEGPARRVWEVAYPTAHAELVRRLAPAGVPPELLQALMREESALDPEAVSAAGAVGLTQLMLPTARAVARRLRLPPPDRAGLQEPATSVRLGAAYLGELLARFKGSVALALAAYNAGENAVERWRAAVPRQPLDEFVEEIPYDETRGYVKRVLRSYASYRLLAGAVGVQAAAPAEVPPGG